MTPLVSLFYIQAAMTLLNQRLHILGVDPIQFKHPIKREPWLGRLNGQRVQAHGVSFSVNELLYVDDGAFSFTFRHDMIVASGIIEEQSARLGLLMHSGSAAKKSKSVAMFVPKSMSFQVPEWGEAPYKLPFGGSIHFAREFCYLGSIISWDLADTTDIRRRIQAATQSLHLIQPLIRSNLLPIRYKREPYMAIPMSIALWGAESWSLHSLDLSLLSSFHLKSLRKIMSVNVRRTAFSNLQL